MKNTGKEEESFLPHLYEPLRIKIAIQYVQQEMRKLLPELREDVLWRAMDKQIEDWYQKLGIRNFWNAIHGISMGFRLKSLVPWITSLNIKWEEKETPVKDLWFGGQFGPIKEMKCSQSANDVGNKIFKEENKEILEKSNKILKEKKEEAAPRDYFPIFVVDKKEKLTVIDGNRRLLQAIVDKKKLYWQWLENLSQSHPFLNIGFRHLCLSISSFGTNDKWKLEKTQQKQPPK